MHEREVILSCCVTVWSLVIGILFFFFFSSRRRHTRLQGDWSSDVCSSDLSAAPDAAGSHEGPGPTRDPWPAGPRSEEHTSELQSPCNLVCRLLLEKKKQPILPLPLIPPNSA